MTTIIVLGSAVIRPGRLDQALALSRAHVARSRAEPGCVAHAVHQAVDDPQRLVFVEEWADQAALAAHFKVPASLAFVKALGELVAEPPAMAIYEARALHVSPGKPAS